MSVYEDVVLTALAKQSPCDLPTLVSRSQLENPARYLRSLIKGYGGIFRDAVRPPDGRGKGGYHAIVRTNAVDRN